MGAGCKIEVCTCHLSIAMLVSGVNSDPTSTWTARMPSDRDAMRAVDLIGGFKPYQGTLPDYKIASKFVAPESYGKWPQQQHLHHQPQQ